jgi:hypothetical protein
LGGKGKREKRGEKDLHTHPHTGNNRREKMCTFASICCFGPANPKILAIAYTVSRVTVVAYLL